MSLQLTTVHILRVRCSTLLLIATAIGAALLLASCHTKPIEKRLAIPTEIIDPPWLQSKREAQLATVGQFEVFHDFVFTDEIERSNVTFRHRIVDDAGRDYKSVHYDHGNGVSIADVDGDDLYDIYFSNQVGGNELWRNIGDGKFENITESAGVAVADRIGVTASFADTDNDGDPDLYITSVRAGNMLFENVGDGKFKDISAWSGLDYQGHSSGAVFFDYNRDGLLDIFLTNVGTYSFSDPTSLTSGTLGGQENIRYTCYLGVHDAFSGHLKTNRSERSILFKNLGNNQFAPVSEEAQLLDTGWSGDASAVDVNGDGWLDLYVLNMQGSDEYYENVEGAYFVKRSREVFPETPWGSMGIKTFDYDNDGDMDIFVSDMHSDMSEDIGPEREKLKSRMQWPEAVLRTEGTSLFGNAFYRNEGKGRLKEVSRQIGVENYWPWGISTGDLNADGYEDVFIASSMNYPYRYGINSVLLNNRGAKFLDSEFILGVEPRRDGRTATPWFKLDCSTKDRIRKDCIGHTGEIVIWGALGSRSSVIFDLDNDGDLDIVTNDFNSEPMVLISNLTENRDINFLKIKLVGTESNRSGLGSVVKVSAGGETYTKVNDGKSGYLSQSLYPLYFGLGDSEIVDRVEVLWPSGRKQVALGLIKANSLIELRER